jgi:hypothetical protein
MQVLVPSGIKRTLACVADIMDNRAKSLLAGVGAASSIIALHELTRRILPNAPRVDRLGERGLQKALEAAGASPPTLQSLYWPTLAGSLFADGACFSLVGAWPKHAPWVGPVIGVGSGVGAVLLPKPLGFDDSAVNRTPWTTLMTMALYTAGGFAASAIFSCLSCRRGS